MEESNSSLDEEISRSGYENGNDTPVLLSTWGKRYTSKLGITTNGVKTSHKMFPFARPENQPTLLVTENVNSTVVS